MICCMKGSGRQCRSTSRNQNEVCPSLEQVALEVFEESRCSDSVQEEKVSLAVVEVVKVCLVNRDEVIEEQGMPEVNHDTVLELVRVQWGKEWVEVNREI